MQKTCTSCNASKDLSEFGAQKRGLYGRRAKCKSCISDYNQTYHKERYTSDGEYRAKKLRQAVEWVKNNPDKRAQIAKARNTKEKLNHPERVRARNLVNQRVRKGRMPKANTLECCMCGQQAAHYHHHKGYKFEHRYDVVPVCAPCHIKADGRRSA